MLHAITEAVDIHFGAETSKDGKGRPSDSFYQGLFSVELFSGYKNIEILTCVYISVSVVSSYDYWLFEEQNL